jgi:hypothetical protein
LPGALPVAAAALALRPHDQLRFLLRAVRRVQLDLIVSAQHQSVHGHAVAERMAGARACHQHSRRRARSVQRILVSGREVHGVDLIECVPHDPMLASQWLQPWPECGDRALARVVDQSHRPAGRAIAERRANIDAQLVQPRHRPPALLVLAQRRQQQRLARQTRQLHRRHRAPSRRLLERIVRVNHLARPRHLRHARELHPLDVAHHRNPRLARQHARQSHTPANA